MRTPRSIKLALASALLLTSFSANADSSKNKKIDDSGDWSLWETPASDGSTICYIQSGGEDDTYLVLIKNKNNPRSPVEVMLQMLQNPRGSTGAVGNEPNVASSIAFADLDGKKMTMQGIPKNLSAIVEQLKNRNDIKTTTVGGKKSDTTRISSDGFKDMVKEMEQRCNNSQPLVDRDFEASFINAVPDNIDPTKVDVTKSALIRSVYFAAYPISVDIGATKAQLAQVLAKYQPLTDELNTNRASATQLQNATIPAAQAQLAQAQQTQVSARADIARVDAALPGLTAKVQASQNALNAAQAVIAPLQPEYDRLTGGLNTAQSTLSDSQNRLAYIDQRLRDGSAQIASEDSEARSIEMNLPQKQANSNQAHQVYNDASARRQQFNVQWQRDAELRNNFDYQRMQGDRQRFQQDLNNAQNSFNNVRAERDRVQRDLQVCQSSPITVAQIVPQINLTEQQFGGRPGGFPGGPPGQGGPGQGGPGGGGFGGPGHGHEPGGPGGGGNPGGGGGLVPGGPGNGGGGLTPGGPGNPGQPDPGPTPVQPPPQRDCSQLQNALQNANVQVQQAQNQIQMAQGRLNEVINRMNSIEQQVNWDVNNQYQQLVNAEESARQNVVSIDSDLSNDQNRDAQIRQSDIPRLTSEQTSLNAERPTVVSRISSSQAAVSQFASDLSKFKVANNWDAKAANVNAKQTQLNSDQSNLDTANASKANSQNTLQAALTSEAQIKAQIDSLNGQLNALNARATQLQAGLANLPAERAPIDGKIADLLSQLTARQQQVLDALK